MGSDISLNLEIGGRELIGAWALKGKNTVSVTVCYLWSVKPQLHIHLPNEGVTGRVSQHFF